MSRPGLDRVALRGEHDVDRLARRNVGSSGRTELRTAADVNLNPNRAHPGVRRVLHAADESVALCVVRQNETRAPSGHVPSISLSDVDAGLFTLFAALTVAGLFTTMLTLFAFTTVLALTLPTLFAFTTVLALTLPTLFALRMLARALTLFAGLGGHLSLPRSIRVGLGLSNTCGDSK